MDAIEHCKLSKGGKTMLYYNLIERVTFHQLKNSYWSDRGPIATFYPRNITNQGFAQQQTLEVIQVLSGLLNNRHVSFLEYDQRGQYGEQDEALIVTGPDDSVVLQHKGWSPAEIAAFKMLVEVMAARHEWEVEYDKESLQTSLAHIRAYVT